MKDLFYEGKANKGQKAHCPKCGAITTFSEFTDKEGGYLQKVECDKCKKNCQGEGIYNRCVYQEKCKCGKKITLLTQSDDRPEYGSSVGVLCRCGKVVWFSLPVN